MSILWFGSWRERKGNFYVNRAFKLIKQRFPDAKLTLGGTGADFIERSGQQLHLGTGGAKRSFLSLSTFQAGELFIFQALGLAGDELDFVLDGDGLFGGLDHVKLGAETGGLLAEAGNLALQAGAQRLFVAERIGCCSGLALGGGQRGLSLGSLRGEGAQSGGEASPLQVDDLQLYEIFNMRLHV